MLTTTTGAYIDVPYAALVVLAVGLELERPRRGTAHLAVLAVAGLIRPEAWLLAGAYWLWLAPTFHGARSWVVHTTLAAMAPLVWMGTDLLTTGNPLFGFSHTTDATAEDGFNGGVGDRGSADLHLEQRGAFGLWCCAGRLRRRDPLAARPAPLGRGWSG